MSTILTDVYSDIAMHCPASYYGGSKKPRLTSVGDAEVALSDWLTGELTSSTFRFSLADKDGELRAKFADPETEGYPSRPISYRLTSRANRAVLGDAYTAFIGHMIDAQPSNPRGMDFALADIISHSLLSDRHPVPWRLLRDGFLDQMVAVSERLDLEQPEPILYGTQTMLPIYVGIMLVDGVQKHTWLVAGHACAETRVFVDGVERFEADGWLIPGQAGWNAVYGAPYVDLASSTFANDRRYTLLHGHIGAIWPWGTTSEPTRCSLGDMQLSALVTGVEEDGDGGGAALTDFYEQYKHFMKNFGARRGLDSYQSGAWLGNPTWTLLDGTYTIVDENSFNACTAIGLERFPGTGLEGSIAIGVRAGDRAGVRARIADLNRSGFCRFGQTEPWKVGITTLHPTAAIKAAAPLFTDVAHVLRRSFGTRLLWDRHVTSVPGRTDYDPVTGNWQTSADIPTGKADAYGREIPGEIRERPYVAGADALTFHNTLEAALVADPPRVIRLEGQLSRNRSGQSLIELDLGGYLRYLHFDAVGGRSIRLAQVEKKIALGKRAAAIEAIDCEDFIDFDAPVGT